MTAYCAILLMLSACAHRPAPTMVPADLVRRVQTYLYTPDAEEAERLLNQLSSHSASHLAEAIGGLRDYPAGPTGRFPNQSVRVNGTERKYGLYVPTSYRPTQAYPLILCLHGAGFDGDSYLERWEPRLGERYLLACPSMEDAAWWTREAEELVLEVLNEVVRRYHVDPDRVILTGMSNGGIGAYLIGLNHPDLFAALVPMAGPFPEPLFPLLENARVVPLYLIHGVKDQVIPSRYSRAVHDYLREHGYSVVYHEHAREHPMAGGHFFPREELPDLIHWLEQQERVVLPQIVTMVRDRDHPGRAYWARIEEPDPTVGSFLASEKDPEEGRRLSEGRYARLEARILAGNRIEVTTENVRRYSLLLGPGLVDMSRPVEVVTNGQKSFRGKIRMEPRLLLEEARRRPGAEGLVFGRVEIFLSDRE